MAPGLKEEINAVKTFSRFIGRTLGKYPYLLDRLPPYLDRPHPSLTERLDFYLDQEPPTLDGFMKGIRLFRAEEMVRIAWRDILKKASTQEILLELSLFAEVLLEKTVEFLSDVQKRRFGTPRDPQGKEQRLVILGMGKLGGRELNFSSDIDLIFAYPRQGTTDHPSHRQTNQEYFERLSREVVKALSSITEDGFCFRVDTRLRPFGDSGPISMDFDQMEDYYEICGREWERYALIRARPVAGDKAAGEDLLRRLRPFIYRRYLDFGAIESLREMKTLIEREAQKRSHEDNLKLGPGGIREIEFIAQAFQLIHGGKIPSLATPSTLGALDAIKVSGILPKNCIEELKDAYIFLRRVENLIQEMDDRQVHTLPKDEGDLKRLSQVMAHPSPKSLLEELNRKRGRVRAHFEDLFSRPSDGDETGKDQWAHDLWNMIIEPERAESLLRDHGFKGARQLLRRITSYRESVNFKTLGQRSKMFLDTIVPRLLCLAASTPWPDQAFSRTFDVIEAIGKRGFYLALLAENPKVLKNLVEFVGESPWVSAYICRHPGVIDSFITIEAVTDVPGPHAIDEALKAALKTAPSRDTEAFLDSLRHFKHTYTFELSYLLVEKEKDVLAITKSYTHVAEAILRAVLQEAWDALQKRYGMGTVVKDFLILGYGKLGGYELTFSSDLDLVFIHMSEGQTPFFTRLGQRIIHSLTTLTPAGRLFAVDMRLRPDGDQGVLISSMKAFEEYQLHQAWTWEHQALVRARAICGDLKLKEQFSSVRKAVLTRQRREADLKKEFSSMREKMLKSVEKKRGLFDIKHGEGSMTDIEFTAQFYSLLYANKFPVLTDKTNTVDLLRLMGELGILPQNISMRLSEIYAYYLKEVEKGFLSSRGHLLPLSKELKEMRDYVWKNTPY